jgi:hypothetical protein
MPRVALIFLLISTILAGPAVAEGPEDMPPDMSLAGGPDYAAPVAAQHSNAATASADDFLCVRAPQGTVVPVPPPFDRWLVVVCTAEGQALVPVEGSAWYAYGSRDLVSILALPPDTTAPERQGPGPRYDIRFAAFYAIEATEERRGIALRRLKLALAGATVPTVDHVYQIDAVSSVPDLRYNIFFYVQGKKPRMALVCLDRCTRALLLDVAARSTTTSATSP